MELTEQQFVAAVRRWFGLNEAVRQSDSYEAQRAEITAALNAWVGRPSSDIMVAWTFPDRVIAYTWRAEVPERERTWEIPWQRNEAGDIVFGQPVQVEFVGLYQPVTEAAGKAGKGQRFTETVEQTLALTEAAQAGGVAGEWLRRRQAPAVRPGAVLYLHGGGYVIGSPRSHRHLAADIALAAQCAEAVGLMDRPDRHGVMRTMSVDADMPVRGIATSGRHGRSFSLGIADAVTVLARTASQADAAAAKPGIKANTMSATGATPHPHS